MFADSSQEKGFTLLELMIVLAIIAVMAAIAIPNYQHYIKKAKFSEVVSNVVPYRTALEVCSQLLGGLSNGSQNCWTPGKNEIPVDYAASSRTKGYVHNIQVSHADGGVLITATSQNLGEDYTYVLKVEYAEGGGLTWSVDPSSTCLAATLCRE